MSTEPQSLQDEAASLYDARNGHDELVRLAEDNWSPVGTELVPGSGAAARFAAAACADSAGPPGTQQDPALLATSRLWLARALTAAVIEQDRATAAGALLPSFFSCVEIKQWEAARLILEEIRRLVPDSRFSFPRCHNSEVRRGTHDVRR